jgi:hypothetical protein
MPAHAELVSDLKALRKGRGLYVNNVGERIGHTLRDLCGVTEQDGPGEIRARVAQRLEHLAVDLPDDLRTAVLAAFGMIPTTRHPLYQERVSWIAQRIGCDTNTADRKIDDAVHQLAQLAITSLRQRGTAEQQGRATLDRRREVLATLDQSRPDPARQRVRDALGLLRSAWSDYAITVDDGDLLNFVTHIEASSLGTTEARALRAQTSPDVILAVMTRVAELANREVQPVLAISDRDNRALLADKPDHEPHDALATNAHRELVDDLKALCKGHGLYVNNAAERIGDTLRSLCGVFEYDGPDEIRARVTQRLEHLAVDLPDDLRTAVLAAFGMIPTTRHPFYQERVNWIAERISRDPRTARRRIDDAIHQLAQLAFMPLRLRGAVEPATSGWHTTATRVFLTMEGPNPEAIEHHRIVAAQDNLREVELATAFGQPTVLWGGTLRDRVLALPVPLMAGQSHDFWMRSRNPVRPRQFVYVPRRRCDNLELRICFDRDNLPHRVSRLQGRPPRDTGRVPVDHAGEIYLTFRDLSRGVAYGARWG